MAVHVHTHVTQLVQLHLQVLGKGVRYGDIAAGGGRGHQEGACFDAVRHHGPLCGVEFFHAFYHYAAGTSSHHVRAHGVQEAGEGGDLRFPGAVLDDGDAVGEHRGHHDVLRRPDAGVLEGDLRRAQPVGSAGLYEAVVELDVGAQSTQALYVEVELAQTQVAAARGGDLGLAEARHERAEDDEAGAHLAHQLVGGRVGVHGGGVYLQGAPREVGLDAELVEEG